MFLATQPVFAADVSYGARLEQRFQYDDNIDLSSANPNETVASVTSPAFIIRGNTPTSRTSFEGQVDIGRFWHDSELNYDDIYGVLNTSYLGLRSEVGLRADATHRSTLQSELTDTGLIEVSGRRMDLSAAPYYVYRITQRGSLRLDADYRRVHYSDTILLDDFQSYGGRVGYFYQVSEIDNLGIRVRYGHFDNLDVPLNESDSYSGLLVWSRDITDRLASELSVGPQYTKRTDSSGTTNNSWGASVGGDVDWRASERTRLQAALTSGVEPSGLGNTTLRSTASLDASYRTTQFLTLRFRTYYQRDNRDNTSGALDRDYFTASPSLSWQFARNWALSAGYRYRWQQFDGADSATSNMAFISISVNTLGWDVPD